MFNADFNIFSFIAANPPIHAILEFLSHSTQRPSRALAAFPHRQMSKLRSAMREKDEPLPH